MTVRRDSDIENMVARNLTELGMPTVDENCVIVAFWEDKPTEGTLTEGITDNLGIQITWKHLVISYAIQPMAITTRHPFEGALMESENIKRIAATVAVEALAMAKHEWERAHHFWSATGYPTVAAEVQREDGSNADAMRVPVMPGSFS